MQAVLYYIEGDNFLGPVTINQYLCMQAIAYLDEWNEDEYTALKILNQQHRLLETMPLFSRPGLF